MVNIIIALGTTTSYMLYGIPTVSSTTLVVWPYCCPWIQIVIAMTMYYVIVRQILSENDLSMDIFF